MSLNAWEQQALDSIKNGLAGSDPELAALLSAFTRLASGEEMPDREKVPVRSRRALRRSLRGRRRSGVRSGLGASGFPAGRAAAVVRVDNGRAHSGRGDPQYRR